MNMLANEYGIILIASILCEHWIWDQIVVFHSDFPSDLLVNYEAMTPSYNLLVVHNYYRCFKGYDSPTYDLRLATMTIAMG